MPATSPNASSSASASRTSASARSTFTTIDVQATHAVITTTITTGASSLPTVAAISASSSAQVPVAAIAGGAAAGVVLALAAVISWTCWGRSIKRKKAKEIKEALAVLQVRENTRKNASTLARPASQYRPSFSLRQQQQRRVTFVPPVLSSGESTLKGAPETKQSADSEKHGFEDPVETRRATPPAPEETLRPPEPAVAPPVPRRNPSRTRLPVDSTISNAPSAFGQHRLVHQPSTVSSASAYSTQSAVEDRQSSGVPPSLLLALANEDVRRSLLANYLPWSRHRNSTVSQNRLSEYSTGSFYSQFDSDHPWEPVGYAIGDEEELVRR
ncbi:hypothetical protein C2E23DRAFT_289333 [Lenzites betulinus]|nr:hypothetical protein C2E23DRAFT_289333 [Lenzites betulinus]